MRIFLSYSRLDDMAPAERVSKLRLRFEVALTQARGKKCEVFFDRTSIRWGAKWRTRTDELIRDADGLTAILTPSFFNSKMCMHELDVALTHDVPILPVYFQACRRLASSFPETGKDARRHRKYNRLSRKIGALQRVDFRSLKNRDYDSREVQDLLDRMVADLL